MIREKGLLAEGLNEVDKERVEVIGGRGGGGRGDVIGFRACRMHSH